MNSIKENVKHHFTNPETPEMRDITREAWLAGYKAGKDGQPIDVAFDKFRGFKEQ